ncbi:MAG: hypothetical protein K8T10_00480 [Candidatus Eremiobacteraeota bacterium]|nr:hypothetical protein [Candidatus Eremiobacteraeota bacterium]
MDSINQNSIKSNVAAKFTAPLQPTEKKEEKKETRKSDEKSPKDSVNLGKAAPKEQKLSPDKPLQALPKPPTPEKEISVLFYMHGQYDDIGESTAEAMLSLEKAGSNENMNVVAQLGRNPYKPKEEGEFHIPVDNDWSGVRRYKVKQADHNELDIPLATWEKMEESIPDNPVLKFVLGNIYWGMDQKDKAVEFYDKGKELGLLDYMNDYDSDWSKQVRKEFDEVTRPYEEVSAPYKNFASEVKETLPEGTSMGDPKSLENFVSWGMKKYPAKHYMIVIMGHGGAWIGAAEQTPAKMGEAITQGVAKANEETGKEEKIDVIMFNSCYMGNAESLYEMKDAADVTIASENYARSGIFGHWGMFLDAMSKDIDEGKPFDGKQFATEIVDFYKEQGKEIKDNFPEFSNWKESYLTLSAIDNKKLNKLAKSFKKFVKTLNKYDVPEHVLFREVANTKNYDSGAHNPSQLFGFYDTIRDLGDFMDNIRQNPDIPIEVKDSAAHVQENMKEAIINEQHEGQGMEGSQGLTFWGPTNAVDIAFMGQRYTDDVGKFSKGTGWGKRLTEAAQNIPKPIMTGFMDCISKIRALNAKLKDENITEEEKEIIQQQVADEKKKALEFKKKMDFTIERKPLENLFKKVRGGKMDLRQTGEIGKEMVDEIIARDGMA